MSYHKAGIQIVEDTDFDRDVFTSDDGVREGVGEEEGLEGAEGGWRCDTESSLRWEAETAADPVCDCVRGLERDLGRSWLTKICKITEKKYQRQFSLPLIR